MLFLHTNTYTVWVKKSPLNFSDIVFQNGWEFLVPILHAYYTFLSTLGYKFLFNYLQLWRSYAILSATPSNAQNVHHRPKRTLGGSHLIWHNFVKVAGNWIKICSPAYIARYNRPVKFGLKFPTVWEKMSENLRRGFLTHTVHCTVHITNHARNLQRLNTQ